jgi:hypothetical protein
MAIYSTSPLNTTNRHARAANASYAACRGAAESALAHAIDTGRHLAAAKVEVAHGDWLPWLAKNCPDISPRTAQRCMQLHGQRDELANTSRATHLSLAAALELLAQPAEADRLARLEAELDALLRDESRLANCIRAGRALRAIRDERLWRGQAASFGEWLKLRGFPFGEADLEFICGVFEAAAKN